MSQYFFISFYFSPFFSQLENIISQFWKFLKGECWSFLPPSMSIFEFCLWLIMFSRLWLTCSPPPPPFFPPPLLPTTPTPPPIIKAVHTFFFLCLPLLSRLYFHQLAFPLVAYLHLRIVVCAAPLHFFLLVHELIGWSLKNSPPLLVVLHGH